MSQQSSDFCIVVATTESRAYGFGRLQERGEDVPVKTVTAPLDTGGYSVQGHENAVRVIRASLLELFAFCGIGRDLFEDRLELLAAIKSSHLMLEFDFQTIFTSPVKTKISRRSVAGSLIAWSHRYNVRTWFAGRRAAAVWLTYFVLWRHYDDYQRREAGELVGVGTGALREHKRRVREHEQRCRQAAPHGMRVDGWI